MKFSNQFLGLRAKKSYDEKIALSLAVACDLVYLHKAEILSHVNSWGSNLIDIISLKKKGRDIDSYCFVMANNTDIVIVFRGSDLKEDWFANFQAMQDPGPLNGPGAHEGFQDALFPTVIALTQLISNVINKEKRIWVTGHSLGGALCSLYAGMLIENGLDVYGIYTFASPRPGNSQFEKKLNKFVKGPHYRVVNDGDIVPHLPPEPFFSHPGKRIILKAQKKSVRKGLG